MRVYAHSADRIAHAVLICVGFICRLVVPVTVAGVSRRTVMLVFRGLRTGVRRGLCRTAAPGLL
jgi:hypothetical protein